MSRASLLFISGTLLVFLIVGYFLSTTFKLFWAVWWYDLVLHGSGGLAIGLLFGSCLVVRNDGIGIVLYKTLAPVILAALTWEYVEFHRKAFFASNYMLDTMTDLMLGVAGGLAAALIVHISATRNG